MDLEYGAQPLGGCTCTLIFYKMNADRSREPLLNRLAAFAQNSLFTHVEVALGGTTHEGLIKDVVRVFNDDVGCEVTSRTGVNPSFSYLSIQCTHRAAERMLQFARDQIGKPFSMWGMVRSVVLPRRTHGRNYYCAELVAAVLKEGGLIEASYNPGAAMGTSSGAFRASLPSPPTVRAAPRAAAHGGADATAAAASGAAAAAAAGGGRAARHDVRRGGAAGLRGAVGAAGLGGGRERRRECRREPVVHVASAASALVHGRRRARRGGAPTAAGDGRWWWRRRGDGRLRRSASADCALRVAQARDAAAAAAGVVPHARAIGEE